MSSLFSRGTKSLVRELGRKGELVPVDSLPSALHLHPFCLVRKKHRRHLWPWDAPLIPTDFSLVDALKPSSPVPEVSRSEPIHLREMVAGAVMGGVSVGTGLQGSVTGSGVVSHSSALAVQTLRIPPNTWETLVEKRPEDRPAARCTLPQQRVQAARFERPLSGGALESSPTSSASPPAHTPHPWQETEDSEALVPQGAAEPEGEGEPLQGQSAMAKEKMVAIPRSTVLAYWALQLVMEDGRWAVPYLPEGELLERQQRR
ncbi:hypothetical protein BU61_4815 [Pontoporia blainvillei]|uniref:Gasdermin pore forming domain-containing protein n=1 Tax=Pontoporia blainvillei TaxID=48723 RepID=A0ABX0S7K3_PONBL|nr:hypothetical protein [Pontoporia blainvillei]